MKNVGFKEWALVCEALLRGEQSIIIRKGGIAEGRDGFRFEHPEFLLLPTLFHEQVEKLKLKPGTVLPAERPDKQHMIKVRAKVEWTKDITDLETLAKLAPFHIWQDTELVKRFNYDEKGIGKGVSVAFVRIQRVEPTFTFPDNSKIAGCKSWVELPDLPTGIRFAPVITPDAHKFKEKQIKDALGMA